MRKYFAFVLLLSIVCIYCSPRVVPASVTQNIMDDAPAFPGAEGFGKYATGGRGGKVMIVSNLNDKGDGSLRSALSTKEPVIVVFSVSGTIHLQTPLHIFSNTTIAGH